MDIFDLIDWCIETNPQLWETIRYYQFDTIYDCLRELAIKKGLNVGEED